ncbi:MAG: MgtC/SapB family protein [Thermoanaerobaculia bacterium]
MNGFDSSWTADVLKLLIAVVVGGIIGLEREVRIKPAGFRTMILIAVGSTLFTIFSVRVAELGEGLRDPGRIAAQIVIGVGFLGAGAILRGSRHVTGLTTAASIWLVASLGIGIGLGEYRTSFIATLLILVVLYVFARVEKWVEERRADHAYTIEVAPQRETFETVQDWICHSGLQVSKMQIGKNSEAYKLSFQATGQRQLHESLIATLLNNPHVTTVTRS